MPLFIVANMFAFEFSVQIVGRCNFRWPGLQMTVMAICIIALLCASQA